MKLLLKKYSVFIIIFLLITLIAVLYLFTKSPIKYELTTFSMGSYVTQTVYDEEDIMSQASTVINDLEKEISWRIEGSDVYKINEGNAVTIGKQSLDLIKLCLEVSSASDGAFDISIAPLSLLWNFDNSPTSPPNDSDIKEMLSFVDYENISINGDEVLLENSSQIDLGAIGKGAACDTAIALYKENGVSSAVIAVGGSVATLGQNPVADKWNIAIRDPYGSQNPIASLHVGEGFISTSGTYEKTFSHEGEIYHHILDPKTGYPVDNDLLSVTVICESGALSDALSTACLVLGYEKSLDLLDEFDAQAVFIDKNNEIYLTDGIKEQFELLSKEYTLNG